ncbi:MAG: hypothetical protein MUD12_10590 [Spirochaetes bacterium]|nr:hypothetical protein [Spirochaetota bacterium]
MKKCLITVFLILAISASTTCATGTITVCMYSDGSGNSYIVKENKIEYIPVQPGTSSSGEYSGGKHRIKNISRTDFDETKALFKKVLSSHVEKIKNRVKGSGYLEIKNGKHENAIIRMGSWGQIEIEKKLNQILK